MIQKAFPRNFTERGLFNQLLSGSDSYAPTAYLYEDNAVNLESHDIPAFCREYVKNGCSAVLNTAIASKVKKDWTSYLNRSTSKIRDEYIRPIDDAVRFIADYAGEHFCWSLTFPFGNNASIFFLDCRVQVHPLLVHWAFGRMCACYCSQCVGSRPLQGAIAANASRK